MNTKYFIFGLIAACGLLLHSCNDFLDIQPTGKVIATTGAEYRALLTKAYDDVPENRGLATFRSDEMKMDKTSSDNEDLNAFFDIWTWNDLTPQETTSSFEWRIFYHNIYVANYIIEHQDKITEASKEEIEQLVGESYMMRAYMHFLLVNLYAEPYTHCNVDTTLGVPLKLDTDVDAILSHSTVGKVYEQIIEDLNQAEKYMHVETWNAGQTYRFNTLSVDALRARVALYMGNWQGALDAANKVISQHGALEDLTTSSVLPNSYKSVEAIVSLEQIMTASYFNAAAPSDELLAKYRSGDLRKSKYFKQVTASRYELKKGGTNEFRCTFRSGEFYLIAAEAANELHLTDSAKVFLQQLGEKRITPAVYQNYLTELDGMNEETLRNEIADERLRELAFEGHRWFDLRRTNRPAMSKTFEGVQYTLYANDSRYTIPIPSAAIAANPGLAK